MRLLVDCHVFDGKFQGTRTYLQGLYQEMTKYSDIEFYFAAQDVEKLRMLFGVGKNIHYIQLKSSGSLKRLAFEYPKLVKEYSIDYAHYQYISPLKKNCREILTVHDLLFLDFPSFFSKRYILKNKLFFRRSAKRADILLTVSDYSRNSIEKNFGIPLSRIHITPNAVLQDELPCENLDVKAKYNIEKYILSVSRIEPRKNHLALLKAFVDSRLYEKGFKLFFVGVPDLTYKSFSRYYSELSQNIKNSILFESVSYNELIALYRNASLFVFPSFAEGFGIPPLEAIENNCPVLCSNTTAMAEFDLPKEWIFSPIDQEELKKKMVKLLENKPLLNTVKQKLRKRFSWEASASVLYNLLISNFCKSV